MDAPVVAHQLKRLMVFRVVLITTLLLIAVYVESVSETLLAINPLYILIAATYGLTIAYALALRLLRRPEPLVYVQVLLDLAVVTGLVYFTGGAGTRMGFMLLYPISVLSGSILLYRGRGLALAAAATLMYAAMVFAVRTGRLPAPVFSDISGVPVRHLVYSIFVTGVACGTVALIGSYLAENLRSVGAKLEEAAEQVADLRELNLMVVNSIHSGLMTADLAGRVLHLNEFGSSILGREDRDVRGRVVRELLDSVLLEPSALNARAAHRGLARLDIPYLHPDGGTRDLGVSVSPLATAEPGQRGYLLVFQDLTEIRRREREVRLREKLAAVGEMAAHLAHEIRNPLGSISGSAQVLISEGNMSAEQESLLAIITRESKRLSDTLNQFLYQARPTLTRSPVDLGRLIAEAITLLRNGPEVGPAHAVDFQADEGPHVCMADPAQVLQVFWNLTRNALEAMPGGGTLSVRLSARDEEVVLSFRDQGRGMGREEQQRVFEPFQSGSAMGNGLGLAIVYRIVREHSGDITVRSVPSRGTEVEVRLPLIAVAALAPSH
jgi:two-component system, NtrC family, sensor histidine kinase PilS